MNDGDVPVVSRRAWMGWMSAAAVGAVVGNRASAGGENGNNAPSSLLTGQRVFNVRASGATGDGQTLDTAAIQAAVDACAAAGGGVVLVPAGRFVIGPVELKSNVTLHLSATATLVGTTDVTQYHPARGIPLRGDHTMGDGNVGLVYAANADRVTIEGAGTIDGQGAEVRAAGLGGNRRCHLTLFYRCTNLTIRDVYLYRSGYHTCRICNCSYVLLDGVRINSRVTGNNDGFHFISAEHVNMTNCNVRCQDDACALFGSCRFISITNSTFSTRWSVFRFGGGVAENIAVSNCLLYQVFGCPIKLRCEPGSRYENMSFSNLVLQDVTGPISIGAGPMRRGNRATSSATTTATAPVTEAVEEPPATSPTSGPYAGWPGGVVRNISFSNISGTVLTQQMQLDDSRFSSSKNPGEMHSCIILNGVDGTYLEDISFTNIKLTFGGGGTAEEAARRDLPQVAGEYFALGPLPAYGLYARNVRGLRVSDVRFRVATPDLRPAVIFDKVKDATIDGLSAESNPQAESLLRFVNTTDTLVTAARVSTRAAVFLRVEGADSGAITIDGGDLTRAATAVVYGDGAKDPSVTLRE